MKDITISVPDKEFPFIMKLVKNFDFVIIKEPRQEISESAGSIVAPMEETLAQAASPALAGKPLTGQEFKNWVEEAEAMPSITLQQAKAKWAGKREQLQQLIK